ncbi:ATP-dependent RNA helicase SKI2-like [Vairimorpha necatrix]|uniref:ATP-dependent RNA helicase SKI2-like n=1 Tax=Vairimorpha necatrix TaxID=6039 RepID=A0AAX4JDJ3_9MICR
MNAKKNYKEVTHSINVDKNWIPKDYAEVVDESILNISFTPDNFQKQSFYFLSKQESVFVAAHTSAGKTLVAEYAICLSEKSNLRTIYTSPIKALSNQKYYDFKQKFDDVGIITGDVQVNPSANCLIMTTEILRNLIYKNNDILHNTRYIVFDEVHYINDQERGVVWEECIIMMPKHITLVLLSATIPNSKEFSDWVGRTNNRIIYIMSTDKRPVPLEHLIYSDREVYSISDQPNVKPLSNIKTKIIPYAKKNTPTGRFRVLELANFVVRKKLVPSIFFCFSRRKCETLLEELSSLDLTTIKEKKDINEFLRKALEQLPEVDRSLPQVLKLKKYASLGIMIHHGALLPFIKECVEILFSLNLIKILIATETFAMGVNMPAKCVAFLSLSKIDGDNFRNLTTGEYTQMSGRAGRRGMDRIGTVLIADEKVPSLHSIKRVIEGTPISLNSQFRLSFGLILIALRSNVKVEDLMKKSYKEHFKQKNENKDLYNLVELETISEPDCEDIISYVKILKFIAESNKKLLMKYKLAKENDFVLLYNNDVVQIKNINEDGSCTVIKQENQDIENLVAQLNLKNNLLMSEELLRLPHTIYQASKLSKFKISEIFCILKDGKPWFDYELKNVEDFLLLKKLKESYDHLTKLKCMNCEHFVEHYVNTVQFLSAQEEIARIKLKYSINNLDMIDEYNNRIKFLVKNNFFDEHVTLKGRVAAEIRTVNEILSTEMIFDNEFKNFSPEIIVSLFSSMIFEEEIDEFKYSDELDEGVSRLLYHFEKLSKDIDDFFIPPFKLLNFSIMQAVLDWCHKESLQSIVNKYQISEGSFVRLILRLDECCREMVNATILIGDKDLENKFEEASKLLKRDIVFLPSLYL